LMSSPEAGAAGPLALLAELRAAEKEQALVYRRMASLAEAEGQGELAQRFHDLHADEQHHLSRLTARMLELGASPADLSTIPTPTTTLEDWTSTITGREGLELKRYEDALARDLDSETRELIEQIISVERQHARELGGKWTVA
jgi:rubrerythrin